MEHTSYQHYHIETELTTDATRWPSRFRVKVQRHRLVLFLIEEILRHRTKKCVILSRPCIYDVYGRPVGGLAPRHHLCVGCLRCTTEHPDWVKIHPNPDFKKMGDAYFTAEYVDTLNYEAQTGAIPVKGAGYRGRFGGDGWDSMWTDMSEIVRPTRDGIHGREFISTVVDIGAKPAALTFDEQGSPTGEIPRVVSIPLPILFDIPPATSRSPKLTAVLAEAARRSGTLTILPLEDITDSVLSGSHIVPLVGPEQPGLLSKLTFPPGLIEMSGWNEELYKRIKSSFTKSVICLRLPLNNRIAEDILRYRGAGIRNFHLTANYHGRTTDGEFALDAIRRTHQALVDAGCRDEVTLLGGGGIIAAEHVPKAIICGLDAVSLDTAPLVALQTKLIGTCADPETGRFQPLKRMDAEWGRQRLQNLLAAWRDQLLEVLGAMGIREVRRLRGEVGRAMFQKDLEREAFQEILGYGQK